MNLDDLRTLLDYHYWARDRVLAAAEQLTPEQYTKDLGSSFKSVRDTLVHVYSSEWAWHSRWVGSSPDGHLPVDNYPDVRTLREEWGALEGKVRAFIEQLGDAGLDRVLEYRTFSGQPGSSRFHEMLQHVVNHASYHRGQVTTMIRQLGAIPSKGMDLIAFFRERQGT